MNSNLTEYYNLKSELNSSLKLQVEERNKRIEEQEKESNINKLFIQKSGMNLSDSIFYSNITNLKNYTQINISNLSDSQLINYYSGFIATCFDLRAEAVSQAQICLYKYDKQKHLVPLEWHPFLDIIRKPNLNYPDLSFPSILDYISHSQDIFGNAYLYMPSGADDDKPAELWVIPADEIKVKETDEYGIAQKYIRTLTNPLTKKQSKVEYDAKYILSIPVYSPFSQHYGMGIVQKSLTHLRINEESANYTYSLLKKGGVLKGVMQNESGNSSMDSEQIEELFNQKNSGSNGNPLPMLPAGYTLKPLQISPVDLDLISLNKFSKEEVLNMCRVPGILLGDGGGTNKSTAGVNMIGFNHSVIRPILQRIAGCLSMYLYKRYGEDIEVEFTLPLPSDPEMQQKQFNTLGMIAKDAKDNIYSQRILNEYLNLLKMDKI